MKEKEKKGKALMTGDDSEQPTPIKPRVQAQIDYDTEVARSTQEAKVVSFMEEQSFAKESTQGTMESDAEFVLRVHLQEIIYLYPIIKTKSEEHYCR